jgi:transposase-like protein
MKDESIALIELFDQFNTEEKAREYLESIRWENGIICPHCKCSDQAKFSSIKANKETKVRSGLRWCAACKKQFTCTVGTIFEASHIPLRKWVIAWHLLCASKKGISSLQIQRMLKLGSYRTALFMMHRIRFALKNPMFNTPLNGTVEIDETYVGGKNIGQGRRNSFKNKTPVVSLVQRGGSKRSMVVDRVTVKNVREAINEHVSGEAIICTDEARIYHHVGKTHVHFPVNHRQKEYARKEGDFTAHTNTVESSFSLIKRGVYGTFHNVSKKHLPLYLAEFDFRWNHRKATDGERTLSALKTADGKRLKYN